MKKAFPLVIAAIVFVIALVLLRPAPSRMVVTASYDLRAGHVLQEEDLTLMSVPDDVLAVDVITDKAMLIGQPLRIDRGQGDVIRASQLGNLIAVEANERAIAVHVTDASGVAGLLVPGQRVGVIASIPQQDTARTDTTVSSAYTSDGVYPNGNVWGESVTPPEHLVIPTPRPDHTNSDNGAYLGSGTFSKTTIEGLRVLFIDPRFASNMDANVVPQATPQGALSGVNTDERAREGTVLLAVPTNLQSIFYDFGASGGISQTRS
ncbi:MAG: RcpC/CpaB family pilus assembly protein, partial [Anaerolineales bacterium]|nr:RcpC/CpaB family pilus assembly protein [Anaerolineales bacterium]